MTALAPPASSHALVPRARVGVSTSAAVPVMGTFELVEPLRVVHFALTGTSLRWFGTEAALLNDLTTDSSAPPLGQMTLARVHGGARHILLYGADGRSLVVRRTSGAAMVQIAVSQLLQRTEPTVGANEWVELPQCAATAPVALPSALTATPVVHSPVHPPASAPAPVATGAPPVKPPAPVPAAVATGSPPPTGLLLALALTLCLANFATLGQWKLEITWT
jgi:hypothetical protein